MTCPKCSTTVESTTDQIVALGGATVSGLVIARGGIYGMMAAPYLAPILLAGALWSVVRKVACPGCGHRFNLWQAGSE